MRGGPEGLQCLLRNGQDPAGDDHFREQGWNQEMCGLQGARAYQVFTVRGWAARLPGASGARGLQQVRRRSALLSPVRLVHEEGVGLQGFRKGGEIAGSPEQVPDPLTVAESRVGGGEGGEVKVVGVDLDEEL